MQSIRPHLASTSTWYKILCKIFSGTIYVGRIYIAIDYFRNINFLVQSFIPHLAPAANAEPRLMSASGAGVMCPLTFSSYLIILSYLVLSCHLILPSYLVVLSCCHILSCHHILSNKQKTNRRCHVSPHILILSYLIILSYLVALSYLIISYHAILFCQTFLSSCIFIFM